MSSSLTRRQSHVAQASASPAPPTDDADDIVEPVVAQTPPPPQSVAPPTKSSTKKRPRPSEPSPHVLNSLSQLQIKSKAIAEHLNKLYADPPIPLDHASDFQLLCAVVLSAQTTDKKVNECTPDLFRLAPDAAAMAALSVATITDCIRTLGLAPTKARNLQALSAMLVEQHQGKVPDTFDELESLPGVGHKTASVVMAQVHGHDAFPVDTHIHRLAQRWGLTAGKSVEQTEADLKLLFPSSTWRNIHLQIIFFGREKCPARGHDPAMCPICSWAAVAPYDKPGRSPLKPGQRAEGSGGRGSSSTTKGKAASAKRRIAVEGEEASGSVGAKRGRKPKQVKENE